MRIVNKKEFLALPAGTLYSEYDPQVIDGLFIKGETIFHGGIPRDYVYESLIGNVDANDSNEEFEILIDAEENGTSFKLDFDCRMRDGLFDDSKLYAIYEPEDIIGLINKLNGLCVE